MRHDRLAQLMQAQRDAILGDTEDRPTHETILSIFQALYQGDITAGRAVYLLIFQAMLWADAPTQVRLYRQAAAAIRQMQREKH